MEQEKQHIKILKSYDFIDKHGKLYIEELSNFFTNNNLTDENKLQIIKFIDRAYEAGYVEALPFNEENYGG